MDLKLRQLRYFKAVVDHKTIAAASEHLHIAQPPLSKQIRQLEEEWGVALFERINQRLVLTEEGRRLYARAAELLSLAEAIDEEMAALGRGTGGKVRVGTVATGIGMVSGAVKALHARHPEIRFSLWQGEPRYLEERVNDRMLDLAIVQLPVETPTLEAVPVAGLCFAVICRSDAAFGASVTLEELAAHPLLLLRRNSRFGSFERVMARFRQCGLTPKVVAECSDVPIIEALVQQRIAVALVPVREGAEPLSQAAGLRQVGVAGLEEERTGLALIHKADTRLGQAACHLRELLLASVPPAP